MASIETRFEGNAVIFRLKHNLLMKNRRKLEILNKIHFSIDIRWFVSYLDTPIYLLINMTNLDKNVEGKTIILRLKHYLLMKNWKFQLKSVLIKTLK